MSNELTKEQAMMIVEAHEVASIIEDGEERDMLRENNPDLLDAYEALLRVAGWELPK